MTTTPATGVSTWVIDPIHSDVEFQVKHLALTTFKGRFPTVEGSIRLDEENPVNSSVTATIATADIDVMGDRFQGHLKADDFFKVEEYPTITFASTDVAQIDDTNWQITGDLTIRDVTRPVTLATEYLGQAVHPFSKKTAAGFRATTLIDRNDFGITWNAPMDAGAKYVGEEVRITLEIEAVRQDD